MCFSHLGVVVKPLTTENTENKTTPKICKNYSTRARLTVPCLSLTFVAHRDRKTRDPASPRAPACMCVRRHRCCGGSLGQRAFTFSSRPDALDLAKNLSLEVEKKSAKFNLFCSLEQPLVLLGLWKEVIATGIEATRWRHAQRKMNPQVCFLRFALKSLSGIPSWPVFLTLSNLHQELAQFESLCEQLYQSHDAETRASAEKTLLSFTQGPDLGERCQVVLDQSSVCVPVSIRKHLMATKRQMANMWIWL